MSGRRLLCMISTSTKTTTKALPSYRPAKLPKLMIETAPRLIKENKAESKRAKSKKATPAKVKMTDFDFVGIAG